jgi:peptidoglycan/LPS O-acetylase OafA/YrhL
MVIGLKTTIVLAWILSIVALTMAGNLTDNYRHGYEDMLRDASLLFFAGGILAALAAIVGFSIRRHDARRLKKGWVVGACGHVACSVVILGPLLLVPR